MTDDYRPAQYHRRAKHPLTVGAGPYGHPFHPLVVTVPIGAWVGSFIFDLSSYWAGEGAVFVKGAFWLIGIGIVAAIVAALFGLLDLLVIPQGTSAFRTGLVHMALNLTVVAIFAVGFSLRRGQLEQAPVSVTPFVLSIAALALLAVSGWLGGKLTYRYGIRVVEEETQAEGFGGRKPSENP